MSDFDDIQFKDTKVQILKLKLKKDDIIVIKSESITPRMIQAFKGFCDENEIKNNTIFLNKLIDISTTDLESLIKQLKEKKKKDGKKLINNTIDFPNVKEIEK